MRKRCLFLLLTTATLVPAAGADDAPGRNPPDKGKRTSFWGEMKKGGKFAGQVGDDLGKGFRKLVDSDKDSNRESKKADGKKKD
jgi:hypothetical protein